MPLRLAPVKSCTTASRMTSRTAAPPAWLYRRFLRPAALPLAILAAVLSLRLLSPLSDTLADGWFDWLCFVRRTGLVRLTLRDEAARRYLLHLLRSLTLRRRP